MEDTMVTVYQYEALANIFESCQRKYDVEKFNLVDRKLFSMGVRAGQCWRVTDEEDIHYISFLGYHVKGFLTVSIKGSVYPKLSMGRAPKKYKEIILEALKSGVSDYNYLTKAPPTTLLYDSGVSLPGNEIDVMLHSLSLAEMTWLSPISLNQQYLYSCVNGHYICSEEYHNKLAADCSEECYLSKDNPELRLFVENMFSTITIGRNHTIKVVALPKSSTYTDMLTCYLNGSAQRAKLLQDIPKANALNIPAHKLEKKMPNLYRDSTARLKAKGIRSGNTYPISIAGKQLGYIRFHFRECDYTHVELSRDKIFLNKIDSKFVHDIISRSREIKVYLNKVTSIRMNDIKVSKCPTCRINNEFIINIPEPHVPNVKTLRPITFEPKEEEKLLSTGTFVKYKGKAGVVYKITKTPNGLDRVIIVQEDSKTSSARPQLMKKINPTSETIKMFYDENNILKKRTSLDRWHELILQGSRLRVRKDIADEDKKQLAGRVVTVIDSPFRLTDTEWGVKIVEAEEIFNLNRELLPINTYPLKRGTVLETQSGDIVIETIKDGYIHIAEQDKVPEAAVHLMMERNKIKHKVIYTVDSILQK